MATEDEILRDGFRDTSESKRKYGGGRVMAPSEMGFDTTLNTLRDKRLHDAVTVGAVPVAVMAVNQVETHQRVSL
jgi:hypothetical protein